MHMNVCLIDMCTTCVQRLEERVRFSLELELQANVSSQRGCWELNLGSLGEHWVLSNVEPSSQSQTASFLCFQIIVRMNHS